MKSTGEALVQGLMGAAVTVSSAPLTSALPLIPFLPCNPYSMSLTQKPYTGKLLIRLTVVQLQSLCPK